MDTDEVNGKLEGTYPEYHKVIIVGAGICGLMAAQTLVRGGISDVIILEAQDNAGGRIRTIHADGAVMETGAQWIHGQYDNPLWHLAEKFDLLTDIPSLVGEGMFLTQYGDLISEDTVAEVEMVMSAAHKDSDQVFCEGGISTDDQIPCSVGHFFLERFQKYIQNCTEDTAEVQRIKEGLYNWYMKTERIDTACVSMYDLSTKSWAEYVYYEGEEYVNFKDGYESLIKTLLGQLQDGMVKFKQPVVKIHWLDQIEMEDTGISEMNVLEKLMMKQETNYDKNYNVIVTEDCQNNSSFREKVAENLEPQGHVKSRCSDSDSSAGVHRQMLVRVECDNGSVYEAEHIIVTCSLGFLKEHHMTMFNPQLPQRTVQAIETLSFGTINKIFLEFETPFWAPDCHGFQLVWLDDALYSDQSPQKVHDWKEKLPHIWYHAITGFDTIVNLPNVLMAWIGGPEAEYMETLREETIAEVCMELLRGFTGRKDIPSPRRIVRSQWHSNPYIRGSYSYCSANCDKPGCIIEDLATPVMANVTRNGYPTMLKYPVVLFGGEATSARHYGTVHGAMITGQRQADRLLELHNMKTY